MARWVDADKLISKLELDELENEPITYSSAKQMVNDSVENEGTAKWQWVEVRKKSTTVVYVQCSSCHRTNRTNLSRFCPYCGKAMEKGDAGERDKQD